MTRHCTLPEFQQNPNLTLIQTYKNKMQSTVFFQHNNIYQQNKLIDQNKSLTHMTKLQIVLAWHQRHGESKQALAQKKRLYDIRGIYSENKR